jgi:hypothetical protein
LHGDFRKIGYGVPSGSVDLILTDAPYESKYLDLFEPLSLLASQVLRQGGSRVGIDLAQRSALLLRPPCAVRWSLLALWLKLIDWREEVGSKNACNESLLFGSHLSCRVFDEEFFAVLLC